MKEYMKKSASRIKEENKEKYLYKKIPFITLEPFKEKKKINILDIQDILEKNIPLSFLRNIEGMYLGNFKELNNRNINSMFKDGAIYISNITGKNVDSVKIAKDIVHEIAHSLEEFGEIWDDNLIQDEFLGKRKRLYQILFSNFDQNRVPEDLFYKLDYNLKFDNLLYNEIGYAKLNPLILNLFTSFILEALFFMYSFMFSFLGFIILSISHF